MRKIQKTLNIILAAALAVTSFPATTFAGESVKSSSASVSSASESSILMKDAEEAEDTVTDKSDLSSARLLVGTDDASVVADDQDHILSSYDGLYLIQYPSEKAAKKAYDSYLETADFVDIDNASLSAADEDITDVTEDHVMTEDSNPLTELADAPSGKVKKGTIALIDTGASKESNVTEAVSMLGDDASDDNGHGTQMAGYITEEDPDARILSIKALDANGNGTPSSVTAAIKYAIERKVSVINLSLSGTKTAETSAVEEAVKEAVQAGIVVIGAAGNNSANAKYTIPGSVNEATIVGSVGENGVKISSSNYGDTVDYYIVSTSTSEAAARLSGIYSQKGAIDADNKIIFNTITKNNGETDKSNTEQATLSLAMTDHETVRYTDDSGTYTLTFDPATNTITKNDGTKTEQIALGDTSFYSFKETTGSKITFSVEAEKGENGKAYYIQSFYVKEADSDPKNYLSDCAHTNYNRTLTITNDTQIQIESSQHYSEADEISVAGVAQGDGNILIENTSETISASKNTSIVDDATTKEENVIANIKKGDIVHISFQPGTESKLAFIVVKYGSSTDEQETAAPLFMKASDSIDLTPKKNCTVIGVFTSKSDDTNYDMSFANAPSEWKDVKQTADDLILGANSSDVTENTLKKQLELNKIRAAKSLIPDTWTGTCTVGHHYSSDSNRSVVVESGNHRVSGTNTVFQLVSGSLSPVTLTDGRKVALTFLNFDGYKRHDISAKMTGICTEPGRSALGDDPMRTDYGGSGPQATVPYKAYKTGEMTDSSGKTIFTFWLDINRSGSYTSYQAIGAVGRGEFTTFTGKGQLRIQVNKYLNSNNVGQNTGYKFEAQIRNYGSTRPSGSDNPGNSGGWTPWGETITPGRTFTKDVSGVAGTYSSVDDWIAKNRYYVIAVREISAPSGVKMDQKWKTVVVEMTRSGNTAVVSGSPSVRIDNSTTTTPTPTPPTPTPPTATPTPKPPTPTPKPPMPTTTPPPTPTPRYGFLRLHKSSSNPEMTEGNPCYTLKGAVYGVYKNRACTQDTGKRLTTNANGDSNTVELEVGTYYVKELTTPRGYVLSTQVKGDTLTEGTTKTIEVTDAPGNDPVGITINKNTANATANVPSLEGTEFTVKYYNNYYSSLSELPEKATRTWVFAAKYNSNKNRYEVLLLNEYLVKGDALYTDGGLVSVPYGTITIQETKPATGYKNDASFTGSDGSKFGSIVLARVDDSGEIVALNTGNSLSDTSLDVNDTLIPVPSTSLRNEEGSQYTEAKNGVKLTDTVSIKNLNSYIGKTITVSGTLYDKATGQPLTIDGKTVTASTTLNVTSETGEVKNIFTFDATGLQGKTVVATESILVDGKEIASHKDLNDTEQMVFFPKISTILYQDVNGDKTANDGEKIIAFDLDKDGKPVQAADDTKAFDTNVTLTDQVIYENLAPSKVYEVTGKLMKVNADGSLTDTGIRSKETSFTTGKATDGNLTASGSADIHYSFDAMQYQNCQLVAFETLNLSGESVLAREEENIEAQKIRIMVSTPKKVVSKVSNNRYEIHTWSITTKIPSGMEDSKPEQRGASFTDAIDSRLDYKGNVRVDVVDSQETNAKVLLTLGSGDYTISGATEGTAGGTLKVTLTASGLEKISKKQYESVDYLRLRFDTLINSTAEITPQDGVDIPNTVEIRWDDLGKVLLMHGNDHVTSGSVRIMKIDNNHQSLAGTKFVLLKADKSRYQQNDSTGANPKDYPEQVSETDGYVTWTGLEDGIYYIRETVAPNGKELQADDIKVVLKDHKVISVNDTQVTNPVFRVADSGKLILQTGEPGRMIILVVSIAAIALAIFALLAVMKRQKGNET